VSDLEPWRKCVIALCLCLPIMASQVRPVRHPPPEGSGARPPYGLRMYEGYATPEWILKGIARTESGENDRAIGDDGISIGRMQLNERFHDERAARYGEYDPRWPQSAIRIASCVYQEYRRQLASHVDAIGAYRQGVSGVNRHGVTAWYVDRVVEGGIR
jgi:hypothetical protein